MNLNKISKTDGLSEFQRFSEFQVNKLATSVAKSLIVLLKDYNLSEKHLFHVLQNLNMFSASFDDQNISAKYHYESNTIFINKRFDLYCPDSVVIHECIHFLQSEIKKNKVIKMGLYDLKSYNNKGLALNEAAVQMLASQVTGVKPGSLTYFGIKFITPSPEYYPLETAILRQMSYFTGTYPLFYSTIYSTNLFKDVFSSIASKKTYDEISKNMNKLMELQEKFLKATKDESNENNKESIKDAFKKDIQKLVSNIQKSIFTGTFKKQFQKIKNKNDIENFRASLNNFNNYLIKIPNDNSFEQFRDSFTSDLISLEIELEQKGYISNYNINKSLAPIRNYNYNFFKTLYHKLKLNSQFLFGNKQKEEDYF